MLPQKFIDAINNPIVSFIGNIMTWISVLVFCIVSFLCLRGVIPALYRLGRGISMRDIAVFAEGDNFIRLKDMLVDSGIFKSKRIHQIHKDSLDKAQGYSVFLVQYSHYRDELDDILNLKSDSTALIVYAPPNEVRIDDVGMNKINNKRNAIIVNMRGRLINDILISLITTSYVGK